ncbi:MAG: MMPL family transporter, partial [Actinomycetota bacterium]|nr:MMPL family transporter [Actinomycetota bacterium]
MVAVLAVALPLAGKVADVEENREAFLPGSAESTQVERLLPQFQTTDEIPVVVVYTRVEGGLTAADEATVQADRQRLGRHVPGTEIPPAVSSDDGKAMKYFEAVPFS